MGDQGAKTSWGNGSGASMNTVKKSHNGSREDNAKNENLQKKSNTPKKKKQHLSTA